ncbi:MAG: hypothetical protein VKJ24_18870 [Synechococcales bacterium]|nr:hypothetical protein [Synechococcales bacterium]
MHQLTQLQQYQMETLRLQGQLSLRLPAKPIVRMRQVQVIQHTRLQLERLEERIRSQIFISLFSKQRSRYTTLLQHVKHLLDYSFCLQLIAEEYPQDPVGTVACLQTISLQISKLSIS